MKKRKEETVEETQEQKEARWAKQQKQARSMARSCGFDPNKIARERARREAERRELRASRVDY